MNGTQPSATRLIFQLKQNPITTPTIMAKVDSMMTADPSVLAPLSAWTSLASTELRTPGAFSLLSNQPIYFLMRDPYNFSLMLSVMFSPMTPNKNF